MIASVDARSSTLDAALALAAARVRMDHKLPLADSIVYATAIHVAGVVWTQDDGFDGLGDVHFLPEKKSTR